MKNIHKKYKIWNEPKKTLTTRLKGHDNQNNRRNKPQNKHSFNKKVSNKKSNIYKNNSKIRSLEQKLIRFLSYKTRSATPLTFYRCCVAVITLFLHVINQKTFVQTRLAKSDQNSSSWIYTSCERPNSCTYSTKNPAWRLKTASWTESKSWWDDWNLKWRLTVYSVKQFVKVVGKLVRIYIYMFSWNTAFVKYTFGQISYKLPINSWCFDFATDAAENKA